MFELLQKKFIKNYQDINDEKVREKYGTVFSIFAIICNILLVVFKLTVSFISNSMSIRADGLNNLSDAGSSFATLIGFKLSNKHPDSDHPYGHGRMEYISGMIVSFLILFMGISCLMDGIMGIFEPSTPHFSILTVVVLVISILVKLMMARVNKKAGKTINSNALLAAGQDSLNDSLVTASTLIALLIYKLFNINLDAYVTIIVSFFVLKSGVEIFTDVLNTILGQAPDKEFIKELEDYILKNPRILGIHDLMFHDYGPSNKFMTFHAEIDAKEDILEIHDLIDIIEKDLLDRYGILTTIHMDPVVTDDENIEKNKEFIKEIVKEINSSYNIHDFRMVKGPTHTNLVFDLVLPASEKRNHEEIRKELTDKVKEKDDSINVVAQIEHSFVD